MVREEVMVVNIAVCDDDLQMASRIEGFLLELGEKYNIKIDIEIYADGYELILAMERGLRFDVIYLDIEMKRKNGLQASEMIRAMDKITKIIYITNYKSYALDVFDYQPFQFLLKPVEPSVFERYFLRVYKEINQGEVIFHYQFNKSHFRIPFQEIRYFESQKRIIVIHGEKITDKFYGRLNDIEKIIVKRNLPFLRIHQSFLVNYRYVYEVAFDYIALTDGTVLGISEDRRKKVSEQICCLLGRQGIWD